MKKLCKVTQTICDSQDVKSILVFGSFNKDADVINTCSNKHTTVTETGDYPYDEVFDVVVLCDQCELHDAQKFTASAKFVIVDESSGFGRLMGRKTGNIHTSLAGRNSVYLDESSPTIIVYSTENLSHLFGLRDYKEEAEIQETTSTSADPSLFSDEENSDEENSDEENSEDTPAPQDDSDKTDKKTHKSKFGR
jgi:hypothetical protein